MNNNKEENKAINFFVMKKRQCNSLNNKPLNPEITLIKQPDPTIKISL